MNRIVPILEKPEKRGARKDSVPPTAKLRLDRSSTDSILAGN